MFKSCKYCLEQGIACLLNTVVCMYLRIYKGNLIYLKEIKQMSPIKTKLAYFNHHLSCVALLLYLGDCVTVLAWALFFF